MPTPNRIVSGPERATRPTPAAAAAVVTVLAVLLSAFATLDGSTASALGRGTPLLASAASTLDAAAGFHGMTPTRIVDTRVGLGTAASPVGGGETRVLAVTGVGGVPSTGVTAVVANLTVTGGTAASHLTTWPADGVQPTASNLNWPAGDTRANLALLPVSADGQIKAFNNAGTVHLLIDVVGWFDTITVDAPGLRTVGPTRLVDTRVGLGTAASPVGGGETRVLAVTGVGGVPSTGVTAVVANLTVTGGTAASHLTTWPADGVQPTASNLNWPAGDTRANLALLPVSADGQIKAFNNAGDVDLVVDVVGWFDTPPPTAAAATALPTAGLTTGSPFRAVDTRFGTGTRAAALTTGDIRTITLTGQGGAPATGVSAVVANLTVTGGTATSHLTAWPADQAKPNASNLNWPASDTRANLAVIPVAPDGTVDLFNNSGAVHVVIDVVGWFTGPSLDIRLDGVGTLAGDAELRVGARGFTAAPTSVEVHLDDLSGPPIATATPGPVPGEPYRAALHTAGIANGTHVLVARAVDGSRPVVATRVVTIDNRSYNWSSVSAGMQQKVTSVPLPGNALHVSHHGATVYEQGFGTYDSQTQVYIASATKWLSGAVIMRLVDRGVLRLDTKVSDVLPGFGGAKSTITLRQLLSFTSGVEPDPACSASNAYTLETCTAAIAAMPLRAAPGTQYRYGSGHLEVAGRMAEVATGKSWVQLWQDELTTPLGLAKTVLPNTVHPKPAGGAVSNLDDYSRFLRVMWNYGEIDGVRYLSPAAIEQMQRDQTLGAAMIGVPSGQDTVGSRYGLAEWYTVLDPATGEAEVSSPGAFGFHPWIDRARDTYGVYVVMLLGDNGSAGGWDIKQRVRATID